MHAIAAPMVIRLHTAELVIGDGALPYEETHRAGIDAYWEKLTARYPKLWNGPFFLFHDVEIAGGVLRAVASPTDYATFLYWRDCRRDAEVVHITGSSLPILADGSLLAARMSAHTVNGGQIYFPAGSLDADDVSGGRFDLTANICRELGEETGLNPPRESFEDGFIASINADIICIARRCRLTEDFTAAQAAMEAHRQATGEDEIAELVAINSRDSAGVLKPYAKALALWHFQYPDF